MNIVETLVANNIQFEEKDETVVVLCPFHSDHHPSASIYKESGSFKCFACKKGPLPFSEYLEKVTGKKVEYRELYSVYQAKQKNHSLKNVDYRVEGDFLDISSNQYVQEYCWSIGFTQEFIDFFNVKYFKQASFDDERILDKTKIKPFYNRIVIPCVYLGKILNYECRDFTKKSSRKVLYPLQAENDFLFNWDNINLDEELYVVEGIKGLSHVWSYYSKNVVSTFGKTLKDNQKKLLCKAKYVCRLLDNDENKIDKKTNKPVDNVLDCINEMDEFYPYEYSIAYIPFKGADPANLTRIQLKNVVETKKKASDILIERSRLFNSESKFEVFN